MSAIFPLGFSLRQPTLVAVVLANSRDMEAPSVGASAGGLADCPRFISSVTWVVLLHFISIHFVLFVLLLLPSIERLVTSRGQVYNRNWHTLVSALTLIWFRRPSELSDA